jgi:hypothetical protein
MYREEVKEINPIKLFTIIMEIGIVNWDKNPNCLFAITIKMTIILDKQIALKMLYTSRTPVWRTTPLYEPTIIKDSKAAQITSGNCISSFSTSKLRVRLNRIKYDSIKEKVTIIKSMNNTNHLEA